jgi:hypothetical protein
MTVSDQVPTLRNFRIVPNDDMLLFAWLMVSPPVLESGQVAVLRHRDDDIALFVATFNIPVSLDDLLQWIASVNDRLELPCLNEFFEANQIARPLTFGRSPLRNCQVCSVRGERLLAF